MGFKNKVAISKHALRLAFTDKLSWLLFVWLLGAQWTYGQEVNPLEGDPRAARLVDLFFGLNVQLAMVLMQKELIQ